MAKNDGILLLGLLGLFALSRKKNGNGSNGWRAPAFSGLGFRSTKPLSWYASQSPWNVYQRSAREDYLVGTGYDVQDLLAGGIPVPADYDQVEQRRLTPRTHPVERRSVTIERLRRQRSTERIYSAGIKQAQAEAGGIRAITSGTAKIPESQDILEQRRLQ